MSKSLGLGRPHPPKGNTSVAHHASNQIKPSENPQAASATSPASWPKRQANRTTTHAANRIEIRRLSGGKVKAALFGREAEKSGWAGQKNRLGSSATTLMRGIGQAKALMSSQIRHGINFPAFIPRRAMFGN